MTISLIRWTMLAITRHLKKLVKEEKKSKNIKVGQDHLSLVVNACPKSIPNLVRLHASHKLT